MFNKYTSYGLRCLRSTGLCLMLIALCSCDTDDVDEPAFSNNTSSVSGVFSTGKVQPSISPTTGEKLQSITSGDLRFILQDQSTQTPAKVSVAFKMETADGKPVPNLPLDSFTIFEDGQPVSRFESTPRVSPKTEEFVYSTLLLLDFSGSVVTQIEELKTAAAAFIQQILPSSLDTPSSQELAVAIFDGEKSIRLIAPFSKQQDAVLDAVAALNPSFTKDPSTNLYGAVKEGIDSLETQLTLNQQSLAAPLVAGALVVFTDGTDQASLVTKEAAIESVQKAPESFSIFSIGLGNELNADVLGALGREGFQAASDLQNLVATFGDIANLVQQESNSFYKLDYCSPKRAGSKHTLTLQASSGESKGSLQVDFSAEGFGSGCLL